MGWNKCSNKKIKPRWIIKIKHLVLFITMCLIVVKHLVCQTFGLLVWCRWWESNPHEVALNGFWVRRVCHSATSAYFEVVFYGTSHRQTLFYHISFMIATVLIIFYWFYGTLASFICFYISYLKLDYCYKCLNLSSIKQNSTPFL